MSTLVIQQKLVNRFIRLAMVYEKSPTSHIFSELTKINGEYQKLNRSSCLFKVIDISHNQTEL